MSFEFKDDKIRAMLQGRRAVRLIPFPGGGDDSMVGIRLLTGSELDAARGEATQYLDKRAKSLRLSIGEVMVIDPELFDLELERNLVMRAVVRSEAKADGTYEPFFPGPVAVREMPADVINQLYEAYQSLNELVEPDAVSEEQLADIVDALKKTPDPEVLSLAYQRSMLRRLVLFMAPRCLS